MAENLLIEIGTEEIPAEYIPSAILGFASKLEGILKDEGLSFSNVQRFATPRRLALLVGDLQDIQEGRTVEIKGPPENVAFRDGNLTRQGVGFARAKGANPEELYVKDTPKGRFVYVKLEIKGKPTEEILKERFYELVSSIPFPRFMVWNQTGFRFARPIRWLVFLYGDKLVDVELAGVKSGRETYGHRFLSPGPYRLERADDYVDVLKRANVFPMVEERRERILGLLENASKDVGGKPVVHPELINEVVNLVEYPEIITGEFDKKYLELPKEVVETAMESHQRYFPMERDGKLLPYFLAIINTIPSKDIKLNNERVLTARLEDARFYYVEDMKIPIEERVKMLDSIMYQEGLGTLLDRVNRLKKLAEYLKSYIEFDIDLVKRGIELSKTDLTTLMIRDGKEFTGLEGAIGYHYAKKQGVDERIAIIIKDHYLPAFPGDNLPSTLEGTIVSIIDRIDHIVAGFIKGKKPTGSKDPLGLRRSANGLIEILLEKGLKIPLNSLIEASVKLYNSSKNPEEIYNFLRERVERVFESKGIPYDITDAVVSSGFEDIKLVFLKAEELFRMKRENREEYERLVIGQKRTHNILKGREVKGEVDEKLLIEEAERELLEQTEAAEKRVQKFVDEYRPASALKELLSLRPYIDRFFDDVLVMHEDEALRKNRLKLLQYVRKVFLIYADFSLIVLEGG